MNIRSRDIQYALGLQNHELKHIVHRGIVKVSNLAKGTGNVSLYTREETFVICLAAHLLKLGLKPAQIKWVSCSLQKKFCRSIQFEGRLAGYALIANDEEARFMILTPDRVDGSPYEIEFFNKEKMANLCTELEENPRIVVIIPLHPILEKLAEIVLASTR